jgi:hypothetical protein
MDSPAKSEVTFKAADRAWAIVLDEPHFFAESGLLRTARTSSKTVPRLDLRRELGVLAVSWDVQSLCMQSAGRSMLIPFGSRPRVSARTTDTCAWKCELQQ